MKTESDLNLLVLGAGTANYHASRRLMELGPRPARAAIVDFDEVSVNNAVTCPAYAGCAGRPKAEVLRNMWSKVQTAGAKCRTEILCEKLEAENWLPFLRLDRTCVLLGVDSWPSRLHALSAIRRFASRNPASNILVLQLALDLNQAQVSVLSTAWEGFCPACGLELLPETQPCVELDAAGRLRRGNLQEEAAAAGDLAVRIIADWMLALPGQACLWVGTKSHLLLGESVPQVRMVTRRRSRVDGCLGPHGSEPLRW